MPQTLKFPQIQQLGAKFVWQCREAGKIAPQRRRANLNCRREGKLSYLCVWERGRGHRCKRCSTWARCPPARADCPRAGWPPRLLVALAGGHQQTKLIEVPRCAPISASTQAVLLWTQLRTDCPRWPCAAVVSGLLLLAAAAERYESVTSLRARYVRTLRQRFIRNGVDVPEDVTKRCAPSSPSQHACALVFLSGFG